MTFIDLEPGFESTGPNIGDLRRLPDGIIVLEAYSENQFNRNTGGPKDVDMLMTVSKIEREFPNLEPIMLRAIEREVYEGKHHTGLASVVQYIGKKPA